jgi:lambda family phage portal protein
MNFLDKVASVVSPSWALKRKIARNRLERSDLLQQQYKRGFEAVSGDRLRYDFLSTSASADTFAQSTGSAQKVRQHVRYMEFQTGYVAGPIKRITNNVVGMGIRFQSRVSYDDSANGQAQIINEKSAAAFNSTVEGLMRAWSKQADVRLIHTFFEIQSLVESALIRDGETLVVVRQSKRTDRVIPFCLEVLEIDRLATPISEINNPKIRNGVIYDDEGVPQSYLVLKRHPGDTITGMGFRTDDYEEIPAWNPNGTRKVFYLFNPIRPEQLRGFSQFAAALKDYQDLDRYREAEIMAALEDACLTGFVKSDASMAFQQGNTTETDDNSNRIHEFAPNKWHYLRPGEDVSIHGPQRPNANLPKFVEQLLSGPANALDVPPEVLSQNWKDMNYSNARTVLLQFYLSCRIRQAYLIDHLCVPTYENLLMDAVALGKIKAPGFFARRSDYMQHAWIPPGWQWVDPTKEAEGKILELGSNFETLSDICSAKGKDVDETLETRARELKRMQELEQKYGIEFPKPKGTEPQAKTDAGEEGQPLRVIQGGREIER